MEDKYLDSICTKEAFVLFDEAMLIYKNPHDKESIEDAKEYCYSLLPFYNKQERSLLKDKIDILIREYKDEVSFFSMMYG